MKSSLGTFPPKVGHERPTSDRESVLPTRRWSTGGPCHLQRFLNSFVETEVPQQRRRPSNRESGPPYTGHRYSRLPGPSLPRSDEASPSSTSDPLNTSSPLKLPWSSFSCRPPHPTLTGLSYVKKVISCPLVTRTTESF